MKKSITDEMLDELERQVKQEMDIRIIDLMVKYRKRAIELLTVEELELCTEYMGSVLENPEGEIPPEAMQVFQKMDTDKDAREMFARLQKLVQTKILARALENLPARTLHVYLSKSGYASMYGDPSKPISRDLDSA